MVDRDNRSRCTAARSNPGVLNIERSCRSALGICCRVELAEGTGFEPVWLTPSPLSKRAQSRTLATFRCGEWRNRTPRRAPSPVFKTGRRPLGGTLQAGARRHPSVTRSTGGGGAGHTLRR